MLIIPEREREESERSEAREAFADEKLSIFDKK
jgi:hypothetical protein